MAELLMSRVNQQNFLNLFCSLYKDDSFLTTSAQNNTIAIISDSDVPLGKIYFQEEQPENGNNGDIFIKYIDGDLIDFSSGNVNISLSIEFIKQYVNGAWHYREAYAYFNREWIQVSSLRVYAYNRGVRNTELTGSWTTKADRNGKVTWNTSSLALTTSSTEARYVSIYTSKKIDVTNFSKMVVTLGNLVGDPSDNGATVIGLAASPYIEMKGTALINNYACYKKVATSGSQKKPGEVTYEIVFDDNITGKYYIQIGTYIMRESYYYEIYFER